MRLNISFFYYHYLLIPYNEGVDLFLYTSFSFLLYFFQSFIFFKKNGVRFYVLQQIFPLQSSPFLSFFPPSLGFFILFWMSKDREREAHREQMWLDKMAVKTLIKWRPGISAPRGWTTGTTSSPRVKGMSLWGGQEHSVAILCFFSLFTESCNSNMKYL